MPWFCWEFWSVSPLGQSGLRYITWRWSDLLNFHIRWGSQKQGTLQSRVKNSYHLLQSLILMYVFSFSKLPITVKKWKRLINMRCLHQLVARDLGGNFPPEENQVWQVHHDYALQWVTGINNTRYWQCETVSISTEHNVFNSSQRVVSKCDWSQQTILMRRSSCNERLCEVNRFCLLWLGIHWEQEIVGCTRTVAC